MNKLVETVCPRRIHGSATESSPPCQSVDLRDGFDKFYGNSALVLYKSEDPCLHQWQKQYPISWQRVWSHSWFYDCDFAILRVWKQGSWAELVSYLYVDVPAHLAFGLLSHHLQWSQWSHFLSSWRWHQVKKDPASFMRGHISLKSIRIHTCIGKYFKCPSPMMCS